MSASITATTLPVIAYQDQRVITTDLLAQCYGTKTKNIHDNFANNEARFASGKHYFKLEGEDLRQFKKLHKPDNFGSVKISPQVKALMLWTERGAARHAKILDTDQAWDVFGQLEDAYFSADTTEVSPAESSPVPDGARFLAIFRNGRWSFNEISRDYFVLPAEAWPAVVGTPDFPRHLLPELLAAVSDRMKQWPV